jgi:hypothetical protein
MKTVFFRKCILNPNACVGYVDDTVLLIYYTSNTPHLPCEVSYYNVWPASTSDHDHDHRQLNVTTGTYSRRSICTSPLVS